MGLLMCVEQGGTNYKTGAVAANRYAIPGTFGALVGKGDGLTDSPTVSSTTTTGLLDDGMSNCHTVRADAGDGILVGAGDLPAEMCRMETPETIHARAGDAFDAGGTGLP
jgi:hypothetical protein